jgi:hypothetical protein
MHFTFLSETPLLQQIVPSITKDVVLMLNRSAQILALTSALVGIFPVQVRSAITSCTEVVTYLIKAVVRLLGFSWGKAGPTFQFPPEAESTETDDDIFGNHDLTTQAAVALLCTLLLIGESYVNWSWVPSLWEYGSKIVTIWGHVQPTFELMAYALAESVIRLMTWPIIALAKLIAWLLYHVAWLLVVWSAASCLSVAARALTEASFRWLMALMLLLAGMLQICTT